MKKVHFIGALLCVAVGALFIGLGDSSAPAPTKDSSLEPDEAHGSIVEIHKDPVAAENRERASRPSPAPEPAAPSLKDGEKPSSDGIDLYLQWAQYPPLSRPLKPSQQDVINAHVPIATKKKVMIRDKSRNGEPFLKHDYWSIFSGNLNHVFDADESQVRLVVFEGRKNSRNPIQLQNPQVEISVFIKGEGLVPIGTFGLRDDGSGADERAGDAIYTFSFVATEILPKKVSGEIRLRATYQIPFYEQPGVPTWREGVSLSRFNYFSTAPFQFTGRFRESIKDGSLVIHASVQVDKPGWYKLRALLFDAAGRPVAKSMIDETLDSSTTEVPFLFFGRLLRQHNQKTAYVLRRADGYLFEPGIAPPRPRIRPVVNAYRTAVYEAVSFSDAEWDSPRKRKRLDLLRAVKEKGLPY